MLNQPLTENDNKALQMFSYLQCILLTALVQSTQVLFVHSGILLDVCVVPAGFVCAVCLAHRLLHRGSGQ